MRTAYAFWLFAISQWRLIIPRLFGLRAPWSVRVGAGIEWPLMHVRQIKLGENVHLGKRGWFYIPFGNRAAKIAISKNVSIGNDFCVSCALGIFIDESSSIGQRVTIMDHRHYTGRGITSAERVFIGSSVYIGNNAIIERVVIGSRAVIGGNCVVNKYVAPGMVAAIPAAREIGEARLL